MRNNKIISIIAAAGIFAAAMPAANAADWVTVSSWAYNDVSNFTNAGLLPESMEAVEDYTQSITRLQFAETVYSMLSKTGYMRGSGYMIVTDTDSRAAAELAAAGIIKGVESQEWGTDTDENGEEFAFSKPVVTFLPDALLNREEMAEVALRIIEMYCPYLLRYDSGAENIPADVSDISLWARKSVEKLMAAGIISGVGDGRFMPKAELSIEQAVSLIYRIYNALPAATAEDGADILTDTETPVQTYSNGVCETKAGNMLYLKRGDDALMSFETDIYSNICCADIGGRTYAAAQTVKGTTDIYDIPSGLTGKIPYPTYELREEGIVVRSSVVGPFTFGLYDYSGNELIAPKYSMSETEEIIANGMKPPADVKQAASGWIYYSNQSDGGRLYRMDSNGENRERLSEHGCCDIEYIGGWLFYRVYDDPNMTEDMPLCCMRSDGKNEKQLSDGAAVIHRGERHTIVPSIYNVSGWEYGYEDSDAIGRSVYSAHSPVKLCYDGEWIYYSDKGILCRARLAGDDIEKENIGIHAENTQLKDKTLYFLNDYSLYRFDGEEPVKVSGDMTVSAYGFKGDLLQLCTADGVYAANLDGSGVKLDEDVEAARETYAQMHESGIMSFSVNETQEITEMSDEKYSLFYHTESSDKGYDITETLTARDADGNERIIGKDIGYPLCRIGDTLYFVVETDSASKNRNRIDAYDLNTGGYRTITEDIREIKYPENTAGDDWFTYYDNSFNIHRYDASTDSISEVFPSGSLHRSGRVQRMLGLSDGMYKVDTEGRYSLITNTDMAGDCIYAENGAETAVHF